MKTTLLKIAIVLTCMLLSFTYGVFSYRYKLFPFNQLKRAKNAINTSYSPYYYHKKGFFEKHGQDCYDIVFAGDSITDQAEWEDLFPSKKIANRGINSDRTDGLLLRLNSVISTSAKKTFLMIGINDFLNSVSVEDVFNNYKAIVTKLSENDMHVYIQSTLFAGEQFKYVNKNVKDLNDQLKLIAKNNELVTYIDLNEELAKNGILDPSFSLDGLHLNADGYTVWKKIITPYIEQSK